MKSDLQVILLFFLLGIMIVCYRIYIEPEKQKEQHQVIVLGDSVQRLYVDSVDMKMKFRIEPIN